VRGIEAYSFSTPFGYIISQAHNLAQKLFDSSRNLLLAGYFTRTVCSNKKVPLGDFFGNISVRVRGIEPPTTAWKAVVLPLNHTRV
jgi:hypothetical protein